MAPTVGVEEEFLLVDRRSRHTAARAGAVLKRVPADALPPGAAVHRELASTQVEFATGVCASVHEVRAHLTTGRRILAAAAKEEDLALISSGTALLSDPEVPTTEGERFDRIAAIYRRLFSDYQVSGCHVHVGVPDRDTAVAVVNHLSLWLPTLLALSANSPFDLGCDTGYASWRMIRQSRLPGSGLTPWFGSAREYDEMVARLVDYGVLADHTMSFWLARPSPRYPTVEVRAADAVSTVDESVLQAALTQGLVRHALAELAAGREAGPVPDHLGPVAVWMAARYGLGGPGIDLRSGRSVPARHLLTELLRLVAPVMDAGETLFRVLDRGTGAQLQRRAGNPAMAVDRLIELTTMEAK